MYYFIIFYQLNLYWSLLIAYYIRHNCFNYLHLGLYIYLYNEIIELSDQNYDIKFYVGAEYMRMIVNRNIIIDNKLNELLLVSMCQDHFFVN